MWDIDDISIKFGPLSEAFNKLFFISYIKTLFDETYAGTPVVVPAKPGTTALVSSRFTNTSGSAVTLAAGTYSLYDGVKTYSYTLPSDVTLNAGDALDVSSEADSAGVDPNLIAPYSGMEGLVTPALPAGIVGENISMVQGTDGEPEHDAPSAYFDMALALAYLCKLDNKLSYFVQQVKVSYIDRKPNPADACLIRQKTSAEEKEAMTSLLTCDRAKYFWGALYLMNCVQNSWILVHSEPVNIVPLVFAAWFAARNASGQFVGNKLSMLRLKGTRIKPLGFPSWLNSEVNENDAKGFDLLDAKNVGYLSTIADNTPQESCVSQARSINGTPVAAQMISKWVDYTSAQQCAKFITDEGTLTNPVLTDEDAYKAIQNVVYSNLLLFVPTKRINNIALNFPAFKTAKTGLTKLEAASSWKAGYTDDLDSVTVTGGITAA